MQAAVRNVVQEFEWPDLPHDEFVDPYSGYGLP